MRELSLDTSALSPAEYAAYIGYYDQIVMSGASDGPRSYIPSLSIRDFSIHCLSVPAVTVDSVMSLLRLPSEVTSGQAFALFRLLAHERRSSKPLDSNLVFIPAQPLPLSRKSTPFTSFTAAGSSSPSTEPNTSKRASLPTCTVDTNLGSLDGSQKARSTDLRAETNPFRRKLFAESSSPVDPPPLPPRKQSQTPTLPPRKPSVRLSPGAGSLSFATSQMHPADIIRKSLQAAGAARGDTLTSARSLHVVKSSAPERYSGSYESGDPIDRVPMALKEADLDLEEPSIRKWSCVDALSDSSEEPRFAMIIVNQPIHSREIFEHAWQASRLRYCADGGANRLYDLWDVDSRSRFLPDLIKGDLDSIRPDVKAFYQGQGVTVIQDRDEYSTDLMKCIAEVEKEEQGAQFPLLLVGGLSGRIDQTIHTISLLHKLRDTRSESYVLSGESLAWVLDAGSHIIDVDHSTMGQTCGILPVGVDRAMVVTKGLKWNLDWSTSFDGDISTSNHLLPAEPVVYIKTDRPILWCVEVRGGAV